MAVPHSYLRINAKLS